MDTKSAKMKIGLICGGPSIERGISLNSARSVMDHLESQDIEIVPIYIDSKKNYYKISKAQLYSNTPSDFDFKIKETATALNEKNLVSLLKSADLVFPVMHGQFGEDGGVQSFLEKNKIPFVGSSSESCKEAFDKYNANEFIKKNGFYTLPSVVLKIYHQDHKEIVRKFFKDNNIKRAVVKPASGGSSIGVFSVSNVAEALEKADFLFSRRMDTRVVVEKFAEGMEFTMIILENRFGIPVALPPTEIETDYTKHQIFDFRKKYLPTRQVTWHCPPRFSKDVIEKIQAGGEQLFTLFGMKDFARFDGWVLGDGKIWFCDFNPISGMEQNSFLFQQASRVGMTHSDILRYVVKRTCERYGITFPENPILKSDKKKVVNILMGGSNSERQVSLMSGTNVWLKLRKSKEYLPAPYLLDGDGSVWRLPYHLCLNHTVEEIAYNCKNYKNAEAKLLDFENRSRLRLCIEKPKDTNDFFEPGKMTLDKFIDESKFVFIALHGGDGENGTLQKKLNSKRVKFNGPNEKVSKLCMNKWDTSRFIDSLNIKGVSAIPGQLVETGNIVKLDDFSVGSFWKDLLKKLRAKTIIIKPNSDGCTTGIARLYSYKDLKTYLEALSKKVISIPKNTFKGQLDIIEMPTEMPEKLLFEKFIETDFLRVKSNKLKHRIKTNLTEITVGVIKINGKIKTLNPSITLVEGEVLTVEEKFQGGTGVNITPPPESIMKSKVLLRVKELIKEIAERIGIDGYSRIDAFVNLKNGDLNIIEINTLPGLTPSTVFYHQGLAESPQIFPKELLEILIRNKGY